MPPDSSAGFKPSTSSASPTSASRASTACRISASGSPGVLAERERNVLGDRHAIEQRRLLEEEAEPRPFSSEVLLFQTSEIPPVEIDGAPAGPLQGDDRLQQHRLPAATLADDGNSLAAVDCQIDVPEHGVPREIDFDPFDPHERILRRRRGALSSVYHIRSVKTFLVPAAKSQSRSSRERCPRAGPGRE